MGIIKENATVNLITSAVLREGSRMMQKRERKEKDVL